MFDPALCGTPPQSDLLLFTLNIWDSTENSIRLWFCHPDDCWKFGHIGADDRVLLFRRVTCWGAHRL